MRIAKGLVFSATLMLAAACTTQREAETGYGGQVISASGDGTISTPAPGPATGQTAYSGPSVVTAPGATATDRTIAAGIKNVLQGGDLARNVSASVQNGVVTLSGNVLSDQQRQMIDSLVQGVDGVVRVQDQLQVANSVSQPAYGAGTSAAESAPSTGRAGSGLGAGEMFNLHVQGLNETDRSLAQRVLEGLRTDPALASLMPVVNINIVNGQVVLQGRVETEQQRQTIGDVVQRAAGTGQVRNDLQVANPSR